MGVIGSHVFIIPASWRVEDTKLKIYHKHAAFVLKIAAQCVPTER